MPSHKFGKRRLRLLPGVIAQKLLVGQTVSSLDSTAAAQAGYGTKKNGSTQRRQRTIPRRLDHAYPNLIEQVTVARCAAFPKHRNCRQVQREFLCAHQQRHKF